MQARGGVIDSLGEPAAVLSRYWFGGQLGDEEEEKTSWLLADMCKLTWTYGDQISKVIR